MMILGPFPTISEITTAVTAAIGGGSGVSVTVVSPISQDGVIELVAGDDYTASVGRAVIFNLSGVPSLAGATADLLLAAQVDSDTLTIAGTVVDANQVTFELAKEITQTLDIADVAYEYRLRLTLADGTVVSPQLGIVRVRGQ